MSKQIESAVLAILVDAGVAYSTRYVGAKENAFDTVGHTMDEWRVVFSPVGNMASQEFEYFTGLGHRAEPTMGDKANAKFAFPGLTANDLSRGTLWGKRYLAHLETLRKPVSPHAASILYSLILDSSACGQSFADWCNESGYDVDSRKAHATYEACQQSGDKLRRIFNAAQIQALQTALQDY